MELWIRTQDKKQLLKVNDGLYIANGFTDTPDSFIGIKSIGHIGKYSTEKRALEVLNEIQNILQPRIIYHEPKIDYDSEHFIEQMAKNIIVTSTQQVETELKQAGQFVYEMPKE